MIISGDASYSLALPPFSPFCLQDGVLAHVLADANAFVVPTAWRPALFDRRGTWAGVLDLGLAAFLAPFKAVFLGLTALRNWMTPAALQPAIDDIIESVMTSLWDGLVLSSREPLAVRKAAIQGRVFALLAAVYAVPTAAVAALLARAMVTKGRGEQSLKLHAD